MLILQKYLITKLPKCSVTNVTIGRSIFNCDYVPSALLLLVNVVIPRRMLVGIASILVILPLHVVLQSYTPPTLFQYHPAQESWYQAFLIYLGVSYLVLFAIA